MDGPQYSVVSFGSFPNIVKITVDEASCLVCMKSNVSPCRTRLEASSVRKKNISRAIFSGG